MLSLKYNEELSQHASAYAIQRPLDWNCVQLAGIHCDDFFHMKVCKTQFEQFLKDVSIQSKKS